MKIQGRFTLGLPGVLSTKLIRHNALFFAGCWLDSMRLILTIMLTMEFVGS